MTRSALDVIIARQLQQPPLSLAFHRVSRHACMFARKNIGRRACEKRRRERGGKGGGWETSGARSEGITCLFSRDSKQRAREKFKGGSPETFAKTSSVILILKARVENRGSCRILFSACARIFRCDETKRQTSNLERSPRGVLDP